MVGRFDRTRTIVTLAEETITRDRLMDIRSKEIVTFNKLISQGAQGYGVLVGGIETGQCSWELAKKLRDYTWGLDMKGVTVPCVVEQWDLKGLKMPLPEAGAVIITASTKLSDHSDYWKEPGPFRPYLGSGNKNVKELLCNTT